MHRQNSSVGIVVLNYNNYQDTIACIDSIMTVEKNINYQIFVVDNNSSNCSVSVFSQRYGDRVNLITSTRNLGYAGGNNLGMAAAVEAGMDYICILNNDTLIFEPFLETCMALLDSNDSIGFVGPVLLEQDGHTVQSAGMNLDIIKALTFRLFRGSEREKLPVQNVECDVICGACSVIRTRDLSLIGAIPEQYFLYYEETEWCYRAKKKAGLSCLCASSVAIIHTGGKSTDLFDEIGSYFMNRSRVVFMRRNYAFPFFLICFARLMLVTLYRRLTGDINSFACFHYYLDGFCNRVDARYGFAYLG